MSFHQACIKALKDCWEALDCHCRNAIACWVLWVVQHAFARRFNGSVASQQHSVTEMLSPSSACATVVALVGIVLVSLRMWLILTATFVFLQVCRHWHPSILFLYHDWWNCWSVQYGKLANALAKRRISYTEKIDSAAHGRWSIVTICSVLHRR